MNTIELIQQRREELEVIKASLKTEFFGLNDIIDRVIDSLQSWYLLPEALLHPVIVNLWGLTGVGKTQLVRSLVKKLKYQDRYVEIQMDGFSGGSGYYKDSVSAILQSSSIEEGNPGILLLDEFQRFKTVDEQGDEIKVERYQDVWMLLSDGKFAADYSLYSQLESELNQYDWMRDEDLAEPDEDDDDDIDEIAASSKKGKGKATPTKAKKPKKVIIPRKYHIYPYQASTYKKLLRLKEPISEIMTWNEEYINELCQKALQERASSEIDYSKLLIFICGNLDEAFRISHNLEDCDTDADLFHERTKKMSVIDIKTALKKRFKPEQIARMGNNHIIYPSLSRKSYQDIIQSTCGKYAAKVFETTQINFTYEQGLYDEVYKNAVFPTQGTRPVFSSIHQILSSVLVDFAIWAIQEGHNDLSLNIDPIHSLVHATTTTGSRSLPTNLDIREQRAQNTSDFNFMVAVHEAGHAVVYAALNKAPPQEVKINLATFKGGYNIVEEEETESKKNILNAIAVWLSGMLAEEMVFGPENRTNGVERDLASATVYAAKYVRLWGYDEFLANIRTEDNFEWANLDFEKTNPIIEDIVQKQKVVAIAILEKYVSLFKLLVTKLVANETIKGPEFVKLALPYIPDIKASIAESSTPYRKLWEAYAYGKDQKNPRQSTRDSEKPQTWDIGSGDFR